MLHVPVDPQLALRNNNVVIFGPYYPERVAVVTDQRRSAHCPPIPCVAMPRKVECQTQ
jgi:hypothetical protein